MTITLRSAALAILAGYALVGVSSSAGAQGSDLAPFTLSTVDSDAGGMLPTAQVYNGHGCTGGNAAPALQWSAPPSGTKSFAITLFDSTARKGAGFWHWAMFDVPSTARTLALGETPDGAKVGRNDFGANGYGGACPPPGDPLHHYTFTVWALGDAKLSFDAGAPDADIGAFLKAHALGKADLMFLYKR